MKLWATSVRYLLLFDSQCWRLQRISDALACVSAELNLKIKRSVFGDFFFGGEVKAVRPRRQITYKRHVIGRLLAPETIPVIHNILCQYMLVCMMAPPAECIGKTRHALPISYFIDQWRLTFWHKIQNSNNIVSRTLSYLKHHFFVA